MIASKNLVSFLSKHKISFFTGVPDSVLKTLSPFFNENNHIIAANEGNAVSIAMGYHLSTKRLPCVYLQNSGLGNAINPLASIAHSKVYSIPILLLVGWRGSPNLKDEPQHMVKGRITRQLLDLLDIKYCVIREKKDFIKLKDIIKFSKSKKRPVACLIENKILQGSKKPISKKKNADLKRAKVIEQIIKNIKARTNIIATTGFTSRELMQIREKENYKQGSDFYMVGGMGHSAAISLGVSLNTKKQTICLDGDGSLLMHLGSMATVGFFAKKNFKHILLNNNSHESVGEQVTNAKKINFKNVCKGLGYKKYLIIKNEKDLVKKLKLFFKCKGPAFLEILIKTGSISNLMRPNNLLKIKKKFMNKV